MKIRPINEGNGPVCHEHAFYSKRRGDLSVESNPTSVWYLEVGGKSFWLCDTCKNTLNRITKGEK
jgi:hypothetical protein